MAHITFIHGISNKPPEQELLKLWVDSLADDLLGNDDGIHLGTSGITTSMVYWADVMYPGPLEQEHFESFGDLENNASVAQKDDKDPSMFWREDLSGQEKAMVDALAAKFSFDVLVDDEFTPPAGDVARTLERVPLPWFIKRRMMKSFLRDVHHYLFNHNHSPRPGTSYLVQEEIRNRVIKKLTEGAGKKGPHIVVSHSMGTVILYDSLKRVPSCPAIDGLMTIGSPLGIDEVQDKFAPEWKRDTGYPEKLKGGWVNVYDMLDPVTGFDGNIANDYRKDGKEVIEVINEQNWGAWRHNITNYLSGPKLRAALKTLLQS
jgi:hypothetical protein